MLEGTLRTGGGADIITGGGTFGGGTFGMFGTFDAFRILTVIVCEPGIDIIFGGICVIVDNKLGGGIFGGGKFVGCKGPGGGTPHCCVVENIRCRGLDAVDVNEAEGVDGNGDNDNGVVNAGDDDVNGARCNVDGVNGEEDEEQVAEGVVEEVKEEEEEEEEEHDDNESNVVDDNEDNVEVDIDGSGGGGGGGGGGKFCTLGGTVRPV